MNFLTPLATPRTPTRYTPPGMFSGGRHRSVSLLLRPKGPAGRYSTYVLKSSSVATTSHSASDDSLPASSPSASSRFNRSTTMYVPDGGDPRLGLAHRNVAETSSRPAVTLRIPPFASRVTFESRTSPKRLHGGQRRSTGGTRAWIPSRGVFAAEPGAEPDRDRVKSSFAVESFAVESFAVESFAVNNSRVNSHRHIAYAPSVFGPYRVLAPSYLCAAYSSGVVTYPLYPLARPVTMTSQSPSVRPVPAASAADALIHRTSRAPAAVVTSAGTHATSRVPTRSTCTGTSTATQAS